jgi:hypothetical protein
MKKPLSAFAVLLVLALPCVLRADEGMWTFDNPPRQQLSENYKFDVTQKWLDHLRLASVRFNEGSSGSFVSPDGLVMTNHHVALGQLQKVSTAGKDYVKGGFYAPDRGQEMKCPDLELAVLQSMEEVTASVQGAAEAGMSEQGANQARKAAIAALTKTSKEKTGLESEVVSFYGGGEYWLYRYKRYTDVRLVFAVEQQAAFYGGDPDNFTYPRNDLDVSFFRVYENGKPVHPEAYLAWSPAGAADGDLVFVSGHPGSTDRMKTLAQLESLRDLSMPYELRMLERFLEVLRAYSAKGPEQARESQVFIFGGENALKATTGELEGLLDPDLMAKKAQEERDLRGRIEKDPALQAKVGDAWDQIATAERAYRGHFKEAAGVTLPGWGLPGSALTLVRYAVEIAKANGERLPAYRDSELESLRYQMLSPAPFYPGLEEVMMATAMKESVAQLGADHPFVKAMLQGKSPDEAAKEVISGTKLADPAVRKALLEGGAKAVAASKDPLVLFVQRLDPFLRAERKWQEDHVEALETPAGEKIGTASFAVYGRGKYPDATFTLRLAFGPVSGYEFATTQVPSKTTYYGLYDRCLSFDNKAPFDLPQRYFDRKAKVDMSTPLNFVCAADIIGGNSGSPVVDREGRVVGLIFDGNIQSLPGRFVYDSRRNRAVAVSSQAIPMALRTLYDAGALADEIAGAKAN